MSAIIILASKTGWHTDQLEQAVRKRGMEPVILPWEALVARLGSASGVIGTESRCATSTESFLASFRTARWNRSSSAWTCCIASRPKGPG
jgi:hypothetical protein